MARPLRVQGGFTTVELLVTTAIMGLISIYMLNSMVSQQRSYATVDQVSELQQNSRVVGELLERDLRHAGFMVPEALSLCAIDERDEPDSIWVSDHDAIDPNALESERYVDVVGFLNNVVTGSMTMAVDRLILEENTPTGAYDIDADGTNDSDFRKGNGVIVADLENPGRGTACGQIEDISGSVVTARIWSQPLAAYQIGVHEIPDLVVVPAHLFFVDANRRLYRNDMIVSNGVEDLQFAWFFDDDGDNVVDAGELRGDGVGADYVNNAHDHGDIRQIRINFAMRTARPEERNTTSQFQALENRDPVAGADGFRRRTYTSTVLLRNVGARTIL